MSLHCPASEADVAAIVAAARAAATPLALRGNATRSVAPPAAVDVLSTRALTGITLHEPAEMIVAARAGTPVAEVEATLAAKGQMLTFEPMDHRPLLGTAGEPTIGGVVALGVAGPRRLTAGGARDSLIGVRFVNGRGEIIKNGGRVMKNVTGLDLVKLMAGSRGQLGVLTEVTFKVLPRPPAAATLVFAGLDDARAVAALCAAMITPFEVSGAAHLPVGTGADHARTCLRLEGLPEQLAYRTGELARALAAFGTPTIVDGTAHAGLWRGIRDVAPLAEPRDRAIWRLSVPPSQGAATVAAIRADRPDIRVLYDWSGGLVWLSTADNADAGAEPIRAAARAVKGTATLIRATPATLATVAALDPPAPAIGKLLAGISRAFDPDGLFGPGPSTSRG